MISPSAQPNWLALAGPVCGVALLAGVGMAAFAAPTDLAADPTETKVPDQVGVIDPIVAPDVNIDVVIETAEISLSPGEYQRSDDYLPEGSTRVVSTGKPGLAQVTYSVTYVEGREVSRVELVTIVVLEPIDDVVAIGSLDVPARPAIVPGSNRAIGQEMAVDYGWAGLQWQCLDNLWERESNWRHLVANPSSGAYGIPQALPADKMATAGSDWKTNPATQIAWGLEYIEGRYGTPCYAWGSWSNRNPHWY